MQHQSQLTARGVQLKTHTAHTELLPDESDYRHHRGGEDNGDAKSAGPPQAIVPVTAGGLDLGPGSRSSTASLTAAAQSA